MLVNIRKLFRKRCKKLRIMLLVLVKYICNSLGLCGRVFIQFDVDSDAMFRV